MRKKTTSGHTPLIMHVFDGFRVGGTELRTCNIINNLQRRFRHVIISNNGNLDAAVHIDKSVDIQYLKSPVRETFYPLLLLKGAKLLNSYCPNLIVAYEWGAIDWLLAGTLFTRFPTLMTVEGFEDSELFVQKKRRLLVRRMLYRRCDRVVVCSRTLFKIAMDAWKLRPPRLLRIPNGVDCSRFRPLGRDKDHNGEVKLGTVASLISLKNHVKLLRCLAEVSNCPTFSLYIAGDGPELHKLKRFCKEHDLAQRVHFLGHVRRTEEFLKHLDIFCLSSITEQMPMSILEAMATGLPVISTDVGDIKLMVSEENKPFIVPLNDDAKYVCALQDLISNKRLRIDIGESNRHKCLKEYDQQLMFTRYEELYRSLLRHP